jgi:hypothetical protein
LYELAGRADESDHSRGGHTKATYVACAPVWISYGACWKTFALFHGSSPRLVEFALRRGRSTSARQLELGVLRRWTAAR